MSFTNAPVSRTLVVGLVAGSVAVSLLDIKHYFYILVDTHIWKYHQTWRALIYQLCYTNSSEVLFASMTLYNMRIVERMWGSRKYAVGINSPGSNYMPANTLPVVPRCDHASYKHHSASSPHLSPTAHHGRSLQLSSGRSDANHLCDSRTVSRHDPSHLQIPPGHVCFATHE